jgi:chloride channel 7
VYDLLQDGHVIWAFLRYTSVQLLFALVASLCVWIEPVSAGSGIPEVKCYLNGIDLPQVGAFKTLICKVVGVVCSVCAGLPVGKEGPMVHSGAVTASVISSGKTRNDRERRDLVACGAAAGVCTAFSAPIGGCLFSLEEGASYWGPSLTWCTFYCSMVALTALYVLNTIGSAFGKVGFNKLFSFGNFIFENGETSFAVFELFLFAMIGTIGGLIGAIFNDTNKRITLWRMTHVHHSKSRRFTEVVCMSLLVSTVCFLVPALLGRCHPLPFDDEFTEDQVKLVEDMVAFRCVRGKEYNDIASLMFIDAGGAIRQLFHLNKHVFPPESLLIFFGCYISLAVVVYGIAVPSGLFVPSLLAGAALGRLFGNLALTVFPNLAFSNTYALIGAAAGKLGKLLLQFPQLMSCLF